jgi:hypothetical protein
MAFAVEAVQGAGTKACLILPADFVPVIWFFLTTLNLGTGVLVLRLPTDAEELRPTGAMVVFLWKLPFVQTGVVGAADFFFA